MKEVCLDEYEYIGADIVTELIKINNDKFKTTHNKFIDLDLTTGKLPKVDLIFCRDCLVHLCNEDIFKDYGHEKDIDVLIFGRLKTDREFYINKLKESEINFKFVISINI